MLEVPDGIVRPPIIKRWFRISCIIPSLKYSWAGSLVIFSRGSTAIDLSTGSEEDFKCGGNKKYAETNSPIKTSNDKAIPILKPVDFPDRGLLTDRIFPEGESFFSEMKFFDPFIISFTALASLLT